MQHERSAAAARGRVWVQFTTPEPRALLVPPAQADPLPPQPQGCCCPPSWLSSAQDTKKAIVPTPARSFHHISVVSHWAEGVLLVSPGTDLEFCSRSAASGINGIKFRPFVLFKPTEKLNIFNHIGSCY